MFIIRFQGSAAVELTYGEIYLYLRELFINFSQTVIWWIDFVLSL